MTLLTSANLPIGKFTAFDFHLLGIDDKIYSLASFSEKKGLVLVFTCNHCPYALASWPLLISLAEKYQLKKIGFAAINANDDKLYPEDSFTEMKLKVHEWGLNFPYLHDKFQITARNYQAQCTPDIYVFDQDRRLYYHGRINDNWQDSSKVTSQDLQTALDLLLSDKNPPQNQYPSMGCSIKWKEST